MTATNCPGCGTPVRPDDRFCEECGQSLLVQRTPIGGPLAKPAGGACVACDGENIGTDGFCEDCGRAQPSGRDRIEADFGLVVGVDRGVGADQLTQHGADVVVSDLEELV